MDNSEPHPLDPDSKLNPEERVIYPIVREGYPGDPKHDPEFDWAAAAKASSIVTIVRAAGAHVCVGRDCLNPSHTYPLPDKARARHGDPQPSQFAADSIGNMAERHRAVLQIAQTFADSFTYDSLIYRYNTRRDRGYVHGKKSPSWVLDLPKMEPQSIRSRAAELRRAGWLEQAGRGLSDAGRPCNTWRVAR